ncbi:hypothetical protein VAR608DRAFT_3218 [Variovorax sp. HW608]|uniref:hypothetical protein n=1 Tax=Variovorax sp. HW608 TaxID=1034889 RepID=UPI00081FF582|nr:hypothetical protein [Variovorax sp. HW608]SCK35546.1 hypothetical protein VAR608DRAFT_3218 [Variovorax sp. HW608]
MSERTSRLIASGGLVVGSVLGMAGAFTPSVPVRGVLWGLDGITLVVAAALLVIHHFRKGNDVVAAGFLVYVVGQTLVLSSAAMDLAASGPVFGAGAGLWAASLFLLSAPRVASLWIRIVGVVAGALFLVVAIRLLMGQALTALSEPFPFNAYPLLVATLVGWAWERYRGAA